MSIPAELKYTESHEWVRTEADGTLTIGITDHAQEALGDIVFIELPAAGKTVAAGDAIAVIESVKAASGHLCTGFGRNRRGQRCARGHPGSGQRRAVRQLALQDQAGRRRQPRQAARRRRLRQIDRRIIF